MAEPKYELVFDQGENVGLKCPDCNQARWTSVFNPEDWSTKQECKNCKAILDLGKVIEENQLHFLKEQDKASKKAEEAQGKDKKEAEARLKFIQRKIDEAEDRFNREDKNA